MYSVSQKNPTLKFSDIFPKRLGIFSPNFTLLLYVPIYARLLIYFGRWWTFWAYDGGRA